MRTYRANTMKAVLIAASVVLVLSGCRAEGDPEDGENAVQPEFPSTSNPNEFIRFLNPAPAVPAAGVAEGDLDNLEDFPEAYYNTIDPDNTRDTFLKWRIENGFLNADGTEAVCNPADCRSAHARFRDTKDLGYGRDMFMRWNLATGDVAVYVENYQVDAVPGVPYGPLNFEALVNGDRTWNFGVNAIEFSGFPNLSPGARKFTKFYNFAGDGIRAVLSSGSQQHYVDLDNRGLKPMPTPCIVCHGGRGRTLVYEDRFGNKVLAPTITNGIPGDVQAQMQTIEFDTLQFANEPGFTSADSEADIQLINAAILSTYRDRRDNATLSGEWDANLAIEVLEGRYGGDPLNTANRYNPDFVPMDWANNNSDLYRNLIGPNCMVCHALRGSDLNNSVSFARFSDFIRYSERTHDLVFEQGLMPLGLLNFSNFWESGLRNPADLAVAIGKPESLDANDRAIPPGAAVAVIAAPTRATGVNLSTGVSFDIPISGIDSAFAADGSFRWSVEPSAGTSISDRNSRGDATLRVTQPGSYTLTLTVTGSETGNRSSATHTLEVTDQAALGVAASELLPPTEVTFYGNGGIGFPANEGSIFQILSDNCMDCHSPQGTPDGIPLHYTLCRSSDFNGSDFLYRSVLARVNFSAPLNSLFLRKPSGGATDISDRANSTITGYHGGGNLLNDEDDFSRILSWILNGAPQGTNPDTSFIVPIVNQPFENGLPECIP